jgi:hypothetical protein
MKAGHLVSVILLVFFLELPSQDAAQNLTMQGQETNPHFDIGPYSVHMPEKFFLLIRKGNLVGAVRLTQIKQDNDGEGQSTYESYFQGDGSGSFTGANVLKHSGVITSKPVRSITHTLSWKPGQHKLWVGNWWFGCMTPTLIPMASHYSNKDEGFEFAPTSASEISEVDAADKRLRWFRYESDNRVKVPVSGLPK